MRIIFILFISMICLDLYAQSTPTYTTNYRFRKYIQSARPTADSLNANWDEIDAAIKKRQDTIDTNVGKLWKANTWAAEQTFSDTVLHMGVTIDTMASRGWARSQLPSA